MAEKPVRHFRVGAIEAAVWKNERTDGDGVFFVSKVKKSYRDGEEWKETNSFTGVQDLLALMWAAAQAALYIGEEMQEPAKEAEPEKEKARGRSRSAA